MSFFKSIESEFKKIFGSTTWEKTAETTLTLISPLLETAVALTTGEPAAAALTAVIAKVQAALAAAVKVLSDVQAGKATSTSAVQTISTTLTAVQSDLQTLLTAGQIKNPATQAKITAIMNTVVGEVQAVLQEVPAA
jgi:hypothetical protein